MYMINIWEQIDPTDLSSCCLVITEMKGGPIGCFIMIKGINNRLPTCMQWWYTNGILQQIFNKYSLPPKQKPEQLFCITYIILYLLVYAPKLIVSLGVMFISNQL